jgi:hypothetical protein
VTLRANSGHPDKTPPRFARRIFINENPRDIARNFFGSSAGDFGRSQPYHCRTDQTEERLAMRFTWTGLILAPLLVPAMSASPPIATKSLRRYQIE